MVYKKRLPKSNQFKWKSLSKARGLDVTHSTATLNEHGEALHTEMVPITHAHTADYDTDQSDEEVTSDAYSRLPGYSTPRDSTITPSFYKRRLRKVR